MKTTPLETQFSILDHSPIGHFVLDADMRIRFWNRCLEEWTGRLRDELVGLDARTLFPHLGEPRYAHRFDPIFQGGPPTTFSAQLHRHFMPLPLPGGKQRIQQTVVTPLGTETPGEYMALFSIQDVTSLSDAISQHTAALQQLTREAEERQREVARRQEAETSLREMDRMKNDFIASTAHELNTPLASILGYSELMKDVDGQFDQQQKDQFLDEIIENALNLSRIIDDLLDISRFEQGQGIALSWEETVPETIVRKVVRRFEDCHCRRRFRLVLPEDAERTILLDPLRVRQVLENIVSNAVKYSRPDSEIVIESLWGAESVKISVQDQGIGMTPRQVGKIFDKFFRADTSDTEVSGLGLGMSIVKQIIEEHGGRIDVVSELGFGTTVSIYLPRR